MNALQKHGITDFKMQEVIHPEAFNKHSEQRLIHFIDIRTLKGWQWIRTQRGNSIFINTWGIDRPDGYPIFTGRGLRIGNGFQTSQHYYGRAFDGDEYGVNASELYEWIMQDVVQKELLKIGVTTIEHIDLTPTWIHLDSRNWGIENQTELQIVKPAA